MLQHVAGAEIGNEFYAVTGSHYGAMKVGGGEPAKLMLLRSNGTALEMLRYRSWPVTKGRDGQYHLIVRSGPIHWLPCWPASLMQEIDDGEFADDLAIAREEYDSLWALRHAAYYRVDVPLAASDFPCGR